MYVGNKKIRWRAERSNKSKSKSRARNTERNRHEKINLKNKNKMRELSLCVFGFIWQLLYLKITKKPKTVAKQRRRPKE